MYRIYPPDMCFPPQNLESKINTGLHAWLELTLPGSLGLEDIFYI